MWNRTSAVAAAGILAVAIVGACADTSPTEPAAEAHDVASLFGGDPGPITLPVGLDAEFVRITREIPGFAGFYYDANRTLNVVLAPATRPLPEAEVQSRLAPRLQAMGQDPAAAYGALFRAGQYDFVELDAMHRRMLPLLGLAGVVYTDADEVANRVTIGVVDAAAATAVEHALAMLAVPREAVVLRESAPVRVMVAHDASPAASHTLTGFHRPTAGGLQIQGAGICTLGFNVRSVTAPAQGFVTSHLCTPAPGAVTNQQFWQPIGPHLIGVEVADRPFGAGLTRLSAAAGIRYYTGVANAYARIYRTIPNTTTIDQANPMFHITAERSFPSIGDTMHKVGRTTGWTNGVVTQSCVNTFADPFTYLCQEWVTGPTGFFAGGDAGAPVFDNVVGNDVRLVGMAWGQSGTNVMIFSAMAEIRGDYPPFGGHAWRTFPPPPGP
jgi:hypothetical protein